MKDPFASDGDRFLVLGSRCRVCSRLVCAGPVSAPRAAVAVILPPRGWDATRVVEGEGTREPFPRMVCASALPGHSVPGVPHGH